MSTKIDARIIGLEPRDINVYVAMVKRGNGTSIRKIAESTSLNRGTTFDIIKKLSSLGLVGSQYKSSRRIYFANPPESLKLYTENKYYELGHQLKLVSRYVEDLESQNSLSSQQQFTKFYEGEEEISVLLKDVLNTVSAQKVKEYDVISSAEISNHLYTKFKNYTKQRINLGIFARVLAIGGGGNIASLSERRFMSSESIPSSYLIIYGDKVAELSLEDKGQVRGILIHDKGISQLQKLMFEKLWGLSTKN